MGARVALSRRLLSSWIVGSVLFHGALWAQTDLEHVKHPEKGLSEEGQRAAASVASLSRLNGNFGIELPKAFLDKPVKSTVFAEMKAAGKPVPDDVLEFEKKLVMGQALRVFLPGLHIMGASAPGQILVLMNKKIAEWVLPHMKAHGIFPKDKQPRWYPYLKLFDPPMQKLYDDAILAEPGSGFCSAFRVGKKILMTAFHCLSTQLVCDIIAARFDEALNYNPAKETGKWVTKLPRLNAYRCTKILLADPKLDFTLFEINGEPDDEKYPIASLRGSEPEETGGGHLGETVYFVGHPSLNSVRTRSLASVKKFSEGYVLRRETREMALGAHETIDMEKLFKEFEYVLSGKKIRRITGVRTTAIAWNGMSGGGVLDEEFNIIGLTTIRTSEASLKLGSVKLGSFTFPVPALGRKQGSIMTSTADIFEKHGEAFARHDIVPSAN